MKKILVSAAIFVFACLFYSYLLAQQEADYSNSNTDKTYSKILVCSSVFEALGKISDPQAKDILIKGLNSKEFFIRACAIEALGRLNYKEAIPLIKKLVNDENYLARIKAIVVLMQMGEPGMEELLISFLNDQDPAIRATTVGHLGCLGLVSKYSSKLFEILLKDKNNSVREGIILSLGQDKYNPAADYIRKALEDVEAGVRQAACRAVSQIDGQKAIPLLLEKLRDKDVMVRAAAKEALGLLGEQSIIKLCWQDIEDKDSLLRGSSYSVLANFQDISLLPVLLKETVASENTPFVRQTAAAALMTLKPYVSEIINKALLKSKINNLPLDNLDVSYKVNGNSLELIFTEALKDEKNPLHHDAASILGVLNARMCLPALREALFEKDPDIVASVAYVLGNFQDKDAVNYLIKVCEQYGF